MQKNLDRLGGLVHSQRVLLALTQKGVSPRGRLRAGAAQRHEGVARRRRVLCRCSKADPDVRKHLSEKRAGAEISTSSYHLKHVDTIFARVFET